MDNGRTICNEPPRVKHRQEPIDLIRGVTKRRTTEEWISMMEAVGVPCGPINGLDRVFSDPHVQSREKRIEMGHPPSKVVPLVANPIRMSESPVDYRRAPPTLGQHTSEVLSSWLELSDVDIDQLRGDGIL